MNTQSRWSSSLVTWLFVFGAGGCTAGAAWAQPAVSSFDQLAAKVKVGDTVYVTDATGLEYKGRISDLSASSLALLIRDKRRESRRSILRQCRVLSVDRNRSLLRF